MPKEEQHDDSEDGQCPAAAEDCRVCPPPKPLLAWTSMRRQKGTPPTSTYGIPCWTYTGISRSDRLRPKEAQRVPGKAGVTVHMRPASQRYTSAQPYQICSPTSTHFDHTPYHHTKRTSSCSTSRAWMWVRNSTAI